MGINFILQNSSISGKHGTHLNHFSVTFSIDEYLKRTGNCTYLAQPGGQWDVLQRSIQDDRDIFTFCRFRLNNHKLPVEHGRWNNIPRELKNCNLWNTEDLGDEFHYLLKCDYFSETRKTCIDTKML